MIVAPGAPPINHLLFVDDSLLFINANSSGAREIVEILELYFQASGHRIYIEKSSIHLSKRCPTVVREEIKAILQVTTEALSLTVYTRMD
jgi:hypothetical protein